MRSIEEDNQILAEFLSKDEIDEDGDDEVNVITAKKKRVKNLKKVKNNKKKNQKNNRDIFGVSCMQQNSTQREPIFECMS